MRNIYEQCPVYETKSFTLRLVELEDAEDLLACYSDKEVVSKCNADYCTSDFFYTTIEQMEDCIRFWLEEYQRQYYVRFAVIPKTIGKVIGTVEIFGGESGVLRIDLAKEYDTESKLVEIVELAVNEFTEDFEIKSIKIKTANTPERVEALERLGFVPSNTFRVDLGYHEYNVERNKTMKNYNMPEHVSPTLEADETMRLYESIKKVVSKEEADSIIKEIPLALHSTPDERAKWVVKLSKLLEKKFDVEIIKQIRQGCYCNENGKLEESANALRELYVSLDCDIHRFITALNEQGAGWYIENNYLYTKMFSCPCPMLEKIKIDSSLTWCHCTSGYGKKFFGIVFDVPVEAEIVHSMRQGFDECLVRLTLPFDL